MKYTQICFNYKYDVIANAVYARELEYFHYDFDKKNFEHLLSSLPEGEYRTDVKQRLAKTIEQMEYVKKIYDALMSQIDDDEAYAAAVTRAKMQREKKE